MLVKPTNPYIYRLFIVYIVQILDNSLAIQTIHIYIYSYMWIKFKSPHPKALEET